MIGARVLLVSNERAVLDACLDTLAEAGCHTDVAIDSRQAELKIEHHPPDLMLVDLEALGPSGLDVLGRARQIASMPAIAVLADGPVHDAADAVRAGARGLIVKPLQSEALLGAVRQVLEARARDDLHLHAHCPIPEILKASRTEREAESRGQRLLESIVPRIAADQALLLLFDDQQSELSLSGSVGWRGDPGRPLRVSTGVGVVGQAGTADRVSVVGAEAATDPSFRALRLGPDVGVAALVPLHSWQKSLGVLVLVRSTARVAFTQAELNFLSNVGDQIGITLENASLFDKIEHLKTFDEKLARLDQGDAILLADATGSIVSIDPVTQGLLECASADLIGQNWRTILAPECRCVPETPRAGDPSGSMPQYEALLLTKTGRRLPATIRLRPLLTDHHPGGALLTISRLTHQHQVETALQQSQTLLKDMFGSLRDAVLILSEDRVLSIDLDPSCEEDTGSRELSAASETNDSRPNAFGRTGLGTVPIPQCLTVLNCNPAASVVFGYPREEMLNRTLALFCVNDTERTRFMAHVAQAIEEKGFLSPFVLRMKRKDEQIFWAEFSMVPLIDEQGHGFGWIALVRDITQRMHAEEQLKRRNRELTTLNALASIMSQSLEMEPMLDATLDKLLQLIDIDAGWIQLIEEAGGDRTLSLVTHRGVPAALVEATRTLKVGASLTGVVAQSGEPLVIDRAAEDPRLLVKAARQLGLQAFVAVPIKSYDRVLGVLGVCSWTGRALSSQQIEILVAVGHQIGVAIENMRLAKEASEIEILRELNRLRSELIANVSHELRTPLGLIKIACTTLMRQDIVVDRVTQREFLGDINSEADKLERIVGNLLDISQAQAGGRSDNRCLLDMGLLSRRVLESMQGQHASHWFVHDFPPVPLLAEADSQQIEQVLRNLLSNAVKYSSAGSTIHVSGQLGEKEITVTVKDEGMGIPAHELEHVFERFYRVPNGVTQSARGAGLGLAICKDIVESHHGRIWAESELDRGSRFHFNLPLAQEGRFGKIRSRETQEGSE